MLLRRAREACKRVEGAKPGKRLGPSNANVLLVDTDSTPSQISVHVLFAARHETVHLRQVQRSPKGSKRQLHDLSGTAAATPAAATTTPPAAAAATTTTTATIINILIEEPTKQEFEL